MSGGPRAIPSSSSSATPRQPSRRRWTASVRSSRSRGRAVRRFEYGWASSRDRRSRVATTTSGSTSTGPPGSRESPTAARSSSRTRHAPWSSANCPTAIRLIDLGVHELRDLGSPERLFQLVIDGLPSDFPPLATAARRPGNLSGADDEPHRARDGPGGRGGAARRLPARHRRRPGRDRQDEPGDRSWRDGSARRWRMAPGSWRSMPSPSRISWPPPSSPPSTCAGSAAPRRAIGSSRTCHGASSCWSSTTSSTSSRHPASSPTSWRPHRACASSSRVGRLSTSPPSSSIPWLRWPCRSRPPPMSRPWPRWSPPACSSIGSSDSDRASIPAAADCRSDRRHLPATRWTAAGHRARGRQGAIARAWRRPRPARRPAAVAGSHRARRPAAAADPARRRHLELRPARPAGSRAVRQHGRLHGRLSRRRA